MIIGIDLGTTNSLVGVWRNGRVELIPNGFGEYLTPSVVSFGEQGEVYVGKIAKERLISHPDRTFREFKRTMGNNIEYTLPKKKAGYTSEQLSAYVLMQLKEDAETYLGEEVTEAIISVPAYFDDNRRCATRAAGEIAGLKVLRMINEPSAAALYYYVSTASIEHKNFIVFDLGGGTLDVSLVDAFDNIIEIIAVAGDNNLGGKNFNEVIMQEFVRKNQLELKRLSDDVQEILYKEAEQLKIQMSTEEVGTIACYIEGKKYEFALSNKELVPLSEELLKRAVKPLQKVLQDSDMELEEIDAVILVGGSTKMPIIKKFISSLFRKNAIDEVNPDEVVARGVVAASGIVMRDGEIKDMVLSDICPFTLGVEMCDGTVSAVIERNSVLPCTKSMIATTVHDMQREVKVRVYQGEDLYAKNNILITALKMEVPPCERGKACVEIKYAYDINGILQVNVTSLLDGNEVHKTIVNERLHYSEDDIERKIEQMKQFSIPKLADIEESYALERAERIYSECAPKQKEVLRNAISEYQLSYIYSSKMERRELYVKLLMLLECIEKESTMHVEYDSNFWKDEE